MQSANAITAECRRLVVDEPFNWTPNAANVELSVIKLCNHTVSQEKLDPFSSEHNFGNCSLFIARQHTDARY